MHARYRITVRYDATDGSLKIEPASKRRLVLAANNPPIHSLVWGFEGVEGLVAAGWAPGIRFVLGPGESVPLYSGPFTNLTRTTSSVIGCGNTGQGGKYTYFAILKPPAKSDLSEIHTERAQLFNEVQQQEEAVVRVSMPPGDCGGLLQVEPQAVTYAAGQSIRWEVVDAPEDLRKWYPRVVFVDGPDGMNSHLGPFSSMDTANRGVLASGSSGRPGRYNYVFQMVSVADEEVRFESSPDPMVDDEGEPPSGSGTG